MENQVPEREFPVSIKIPSGKARKVGCQISLPSFTGGKKGHNSVFLVNSFGFVMCIISYSSIGERLSHGDT